MVTELGLLSLFLTEGDFYVVDAGESFDASRRNAWLSRDVFLPVAGFPLAFLTRFKAYRFIV